MSELQIGSLHFRTKSEAMKWFGTVLSSSSVGAFCPEESMRNMIELINRHPDAEMKIGCGIESFQVRENPVFKNQKAFYLIRKDGSETDFSFRMCVSGNRSTPWANFCIAARNSISSQIVIFKTAAFLGLDSVRCQITGEVVEWNTCHIDHVAPFSDLLQEFIRQQGIDVSVEHTTGGEDGSVVRLFIDADLDKRWREFHRQNAVLRVTTIKANLARNRQ